MRAFKDCEYVVNIIGTQGTLFGLNCWQFVISDHTMFQKRRPEDTGKMVFYTWLANLKPEGTHSCVGILWCGKVESQKSFRNKKDCKRNWERFAKINDWKNWRYEPIKEYKPFKNMIGRLIDNEGA